MPTIDRDRLQVVVGVLRNQSGQYLVQKRQQGKPRAGQWEYPGGKIEPGETALTALYRELNEELGISVKQANQLMLLDYDYAHAKVRLHVYMIKRFTGQVSAAEGQTLNWYGLEQIAKMDVLDAVYPINEKLAELKSVE